MPDELLDKLGDYFVQEGIRALTGLTFAQFIDHYQTGRWRVMI